MCIRVQPGVPAFTVKQPEDAMAVLRDRARETGVSVCSLSRPRCCPVWVLPPTALLRLGSLRSKLSQCPLRVCPELDDYRKHCGPLRLGLAGQHQHSNASLAIQLSHTWLQRRRGPGVEPSELLLPIQTATSSVYSCVLPHLLTDQSSPPAPEDSRAAQVRPSPVTVKGRC